MRKLTVKIGASIAPGLKGIQDFKKLKLGNCVLTKIASSKEEALAVAKFCKDNKFTMFFSEFLERGSTKTQPLQLQLQSFSPAKESKDIARGFYSKNDLQEIIEAAGEYYGGRYTQGESGGCLCWPKSYLINRRAGCYENLKPSQNMLDARNAYVEYIKNLLEYDEKAYAGKPFIAIESCVVFKYCHEIGFDVLFCELMPGDPYRMLPAIRGVATAFDKAWGSHIAIEHYGGMSFDGLWMKRWKTSLYYSYIAGARYIFPESGHLCYTMRQKNDKFCSFNNKDVKTVRSILREINRFSHTHTRPENGPLVKLAVLHGYLDGAPAKWSPYVWGQYHDKKWEKGAAEDGWKLLDYFYRKEPWQNPYVQGESDFSGNPPLGQYDVVPIEAASEKLKQYSCLVCLGWNTMTEEIYVKLKDYVRSGGHLLMFLPQLSTRMDRTFETGLFNNGDFRDLFGVEIVGKHPKDAYGFKCLRNSSLKSYRFPLWRINTDPRFAGICTPAKVKMEGAKTISGWADYYTQEREVLEASPAIVENSLGYGKAFLVTLFEYPADDSILALTKDILRTVLAGEQGDIRLVANDAMRYAIYQDSVDGKDFKIVYMLNTDPHNDACVMLWIKGKTTSSFFVSANEMRIAYILDSIVISPENRYIDLKAWTVNGGTNKYIFYSLENQQALIFNLGAKTKFEICGKNSVLSAKETATVRIKRLIKLDKKEFYAKEFPAEPRIANGDPRTPY